MFGKGENYYVSDCLYEYRKNEYVYVLLSNVRFPDASSEEGRFGLLSCVNLRMRHTFVFGKIPGSIWIPVFLWLDYLKEVGIMKKTVYDVYEYRCCMRMPACRRCRNGQDT